MAAETAVETPEGQVKDGQYADLLREMLSRWEYANDRWQPIRDERRTDMRYVSGDPWDSDDRMLREDAGRPVISFDEFGQYVNQLINEVRQHKRAIKVTPIGDGANDTIAQFRANLIRQIEYRSNAQQAYTGMFENAVQGSYGFLRLKAQYVNSPNKSGGHGSSFDQEVVIVPLPNPDLVTIDPDIQRPDGADMRYAWIAESWALSDYKRRWPKAKVQDFSPDLAKGMPQSWPYDYKRIQVAEYFTIEEQRRNLLLFKDPSGGSDLEIFEDELDSEPMFAPLKGLTPSKERMVDAPTVMHYLTNGFEILEKPTIWPGLSIPIVCCFGKTLYVDQGSGNTRVILSLVRLARDPAMLLSYYVSCEAELVGMTPKVPYFVRRGSLKPDQLLELQKSLHEPVAVIEVEMTADTMPAGVVPEMPMRNTYEPPIAALEVGKEGARRAIQAAMGISPLPTQAQRKNEKSGVALQEMRNAEQQGSFHFIDNYEMSVTRVGVLINEVLDTYYDTARTVTIRTPADDPQVVRINDPHQLEEGQTEPVMLGQGRFDITLSTGPKYDSERDAASAFADVLLASNFAPAIVDLAVKLKNLGPIGDEMVERLQALLPGPVQAVIKSKSANPAQLMAQLGQASQMVQALSKELQGRVQQIQTEEVKAQRDLALEKLKHDFEIERLKIESVLKGQVEASKDAIALKKIDADLLKTRATLEVQQTEAMIDASVKQDNAQVAMAGEREARQDAAVQADKDRAFQSSEAERSRQHESVESAEDRAAASAKTTEPSKS